MEVRTIWVRMAASALPMVIAGSTRFANVPEPETGSQPNLIENNRIRIGPMAKFGNESPKRLTTLMARSSQSLRRRGGGTPSRPGGRNGTPQPRSRELQRIRVALAQELADALVIAKRDSKIATHHTLPIIQILLAQRKIESVGVARRLQIRSRCAFPEHLLNRVAGHEMDQEKNERYDQPDDRQRVENPG